MVSDGLENIQTWWKKSFSIPKKITILLRVITIRKIQKHLQYTMGEWVTEGFLQNITACNFLYSETRKNLMMGKMLYSIQGEKEVGISIQLLCQGSNRLKIK